MLGRNTEWEYWLNMADRHYKTPDTVKTMGLTGNPNANNNGDYEFIGQIMKTILINKAEGGSEPALILRRYETGDGIVALCEVISYYVEVTGYGLIEIMKHIHEPVPAKADEDVAKAIEKWYDDYQQAVKMGMPALEDAHKITILKIISTKTGVDRLEEKEYNKFVDAWGSS